MDMATARAQLAGVDAQITAHLLQVCEDMTQPIASGTFTPSGNNNVVNIPMRYVGLTRGWLLKINQQFVNNDAGSHAATLTDWGAANLISNFTVTDLDNYQRVNTTGWHAFMLNTAKEGWPFGGALLNTAIDTPIKMGNVFSAISATASIAAGGGTGTIQMYYWIPAAYSKKDLRGAIYTGVVNATGYVQFTINPIPFVATGTDPTLAVYTGGGTAGSTTYGTCTYTLYQNYLDQVPRYASGPNAGYPILPPLSVRSQYRLQNTSLSAISANQDFPIPFTNFQSFLSASLIYDQNGTLNAGTDVNQFKLTAANTLQFFNLDPITQALRGRVRIKTDWPKGSYMFDFREQPISTNQAGNMQLILNPSSAAAQSQLLVGWESFADVNTVLGAQSLPAS
jgi:hypothetical protein